MPARWHTSAFLAIALASHLSTNVHGERYAANPVRRVVKMLQDIQSKVVSEGERDKKLMDDFECYCKKGNAQLTKSIQDATAKIPKLESTVQEAAASKVQLDADLVQHKKDVETTKATLKEAETIREKEAVTFAKDSASMKADVEAMKKAADAVFKGMSGTMEFLQTSAASRIQKVLADYDDIVSDDDRETITAFLSGESEQSEDYAPRGGEIVGILKQMRETMSKSLKDATVQEKTAIADFEALSAAKKKQAFALTDQIESKTARLGQVGVRIADLKDDLQQTTISLEEDQKYIADLENACKTRGAEFQQRAMIRQEELQALTACIKTLNDDEALEMFKKTLPQPSLLQVQETNPERMRRARNALQQKRGKHDLRIDLISLAMRGKKANFNKVMGMIDTMVRLLQKEQVADDRKRSHCKKEFDSSDDEKKSLEHTVESLAKSLANAKNALATVTEEIAALEEEITTTDAQVAQLTADRKKEHDAYVTELSDNNFAKSVLEKAANQLNKFYNARLAKSAMLIQQRERRLAKSLDLDAPPPEPETMGAYKKQDTNGVFAILHNLAMDIEKDVNVMKTEEAEAQREYEQTMKDSALKRSADAKTLEQKAGYKAELADDMQKEKEERMSKKRDQMANDKYIMSLHSDCDWLLANFDVRKAARDGEIDAMTRAKDVLAGADYSFLQIRSRSLRARLTAP